VLGVAIILVKVSVSQIADDGGLSHAIAAFVLSSSMALGAAFRYRARARMRNSTRPSCSNANGWTCSSCE
jgi:hypothetical protein